MPPVPAASSTLPRSRDVIGSRAVPSVVVQGGPSGPDPALDPALDRARKIARVLDHYFVDPIVGLVAPGAGDVIGSLLGLYTVAIAVRRRTSPVIIARMLLNLGIDALLGVVPVLGDLGDLGYRANSRNIDLLASRSRTGGKATGKDWLILAGAALAFLLAVAGAVFLIGALVRWIGSL